jgi:hypothetical protein
LRLVAAEAPRRSAEEGSHAMLFVAERAPQQEQRDKPEGPAVREQSWTHVQRCTDRETLWLLGRLALPGQQLRRAGRHHGPDADVRAVAAAVDARKAPRGV